MEITKAYLAKQVDEITLQQADVVLILEQEDGEHRVMGLGGLGGSRLELPPYLSCLTQQHPLNGLLKQVLL